MFLPAINIFFQNYKLSEFEGDISFNCNYALNYSK